MVNFRKNVYLAFLFTCQIEWEWRAPVWAFPPGPRFRWASGEREGGMRAQAACFTDWAGLVLLGLAKESRPSGLLRGQEMERGRAGLKGRWWKLFKWNCFYFFSKPSIQIKNFWIVFKFKPFVLSKLKGIKHFKLCKLI